MATGITKYKTFDIDRFGRDVYQHRGSLNLTRKEYMSMIGMNDPSWLNRIENASIVNQKSANITGILRILEFMHRDIMDYYK